MSFLKAFSQPEDILKKLLREGCRANFEDDLQILNDHIFNFSITAHALRDWCIAFMGADDSKNQLHENWNKEKSLVAARDIANSSKHFGISESRSKSLSGTEAVSQRMISFNSFDSFIETSGSLRKKKDYIDQISHDTPSLMIIFDGGMEINLTDYMVQLISFWLKFFDDNRIPRDPALNAALIFIDMKYWDSALSEGCDA